MTGYSSRFADSQPPNAIPKRAESAKLDAQMREYLERGGTIKRIDHGDEVGINYMTMETRPKMLARIKRGNDKRWNGAERVKA